MEDTITAIATAYGEGGIGIVRISGGKAKEILDRIFVPANGRPVEARRFTYGSVKDGDETIDEVMAVYMNAPYTYTREDVVEIDCHGSIVSLRKTLETVLKNGARMAEPGEFTRRAFLNGRLDLSQAEAVIDLIRAKTDRTFDIAMKQLEGAFSERIREIRKDLLDILVDVTVNIDYPDEDIEELTYSKLIRDLEAVSDRVGVLGKTVNEGRIMREGLKVCLVGKPNVGKSSLMNALLKENRVIVTQIPGTTRDAIEEEMNIDGIPVVLTDTAGIRDTEDEVEKIGIEKSKEAFNRADLIVLMLDSGNPLEEEDHALITQVGERKCLVALNKCDTGKTLDTAELQALLPGGEIIYVSALNDIGIDEIKSRIKDMVFGGEAVQKESFVVTNARHGELIRQSAENLTEAIGMAGRREPLEFIEVDINSAYQLLGEIIGETVADDFIDEVFARFCLGK